MMEATELRAALPREPLREGPDLPWPRVASGKVREIYDVGEGRLLILATDRISAFDVILPGGIAGKGILLTQLSLWWFAQTYRLVPNHLVPEHDTALAALLKDHAGLIPRCMLVRKMEVLPLEAVVRGYLSGSGWQAYRESGKLFDQELPEGLRESDPLPRPYFTPTTKAASGHDEPMSLDACLDLLKPAGFNDVITAAFQLYVLGADRVSEAGVLLADTKFEFGRDGNGTLHVVDEILTPDSSRYWPAEEYAPGKAQPSYDKQIVRDYLSGLDWDRTAPGPELPAEVIERTRERYLLLCERLMSDPFSGPVDPATSA